jgi:hypothetical protein
MRKYYVKFDWGQKRHGQGVPSGLLRDPARSFLHSRR